MRELGLVAPEFSVVLIFRLVFVLIFLPSAWGKVRDLAAFRTGVANYQLVPTAFLPLLTLGIPMLELLLAFSMLTGIWSVISAYLIVGLLVVFIGAVSINLYRRRDIACACAGSAPQQRISWCLVVRNSLLVGMALWLGMTSRFHNTTLANEQTVAHLPLTVMLIGCSISIITILHLIEQSIALAVRTLSAITMTFRALCA